MKCVKHVHLDFGLDELSVKAFFDDCVADQLEKAEARLAKAISACYSRVQRGSCDALIIKSGHSYALVTPSVKHQGSCQTTYFCTMNGRLYPTTHTHTNMFDCDDIDIYHVIF